MPYLHGIPCYTKLASFLHIVLIKTNYTLILPMGDQQLAQPMAYLFNEAICMSCFPTAHKSAEVGPQHKKADLLRKENYRPVQSAS